MSKWISLKKEKPPIDTPVLVFQQGYDVTGKHYWWHIRIAEYVLPPRFKKRLVFGTNIRRDEGKVWDGFPIDDVTHWMPLPRPPERSKAYRDGK